MGIRKTRISLTLDTKNTEDRTRHGSDSGTNREHGPDGPLSPSERARKEKEDMRDDAIYKKIIKGQIIDSCETTLSGILTLDGIKYEDLAVDRRRVIVCQDVNDVEFTASGYIHLTDPIYIAVEIDGSVDRHGVHIGRIKDTYRDMTIWGKDEDGKRWTPKEYLIARLSE